MYLIMPCPCQNPLSFVISLFSLLSFIYTQEPWVSKTQSYGEMVPSSLPNNGQLPSTDDNVLSSLRPSSLYPLISIYLLKSCSPNSNHISKDLCKLEETKGTEILTHLESNINVVVWKQGWTNY